MRHENAETDRGAAGFTMVEMIVAMLAASLLALTAGAMVFYSHLAWRRNLAAVELQRDASTAMRMLTHRIREASTADVAAQPGRITIQTTNAPLSFYRNANDLLYDPDTSAAGDEIIVVPGRLTVFLPTNRTVGVSILLELAEGDERVRVNSMTTFRN